MGKYICLWCKDTKVYVGAGMDDTQPCGECLPKPSKGTDGHYRYQLKFAIHGPITGIMRW